MCVCFCVYVCVFCRLSPAERLLWSWGKNGRAEGSRAALASVSCWNLDPIIGSPLTRVFLPHACAFLFPLGLH